MTEPTGTQEENEDGTEGTTEVPAGGKNWQAEADKWKALARKHESDAKKLAALEEGQKTEAQKLADARATAEKERDEARAELLRRDVAAKAGLPVELASRLRGSTEAELEADAKELLKLVPKPPATNVRAVADLRPGALPAADVHSSTFDADAFIRDKARRR